MANSRSSRIIKYKMISCLLFSEDYTLSFLMQYVAYFIRRNSQTDSFFFFGITYLSKKIFI
jgi:hypothetical protein